MNLSVQPRFGVTWNPEMAMVSNARTVDVPTEMILRCRFLAQLIVIDVFGETSNYSESIW